MEDDKIMQIISSFGLSFGVFTILGIPFLNDVVSFLAIGGASVVATPVVYFGFKRINERWWKGKKRD